MLTVARGGEARVRVYDAQGRVAATYSQDLVPPGPPVLRWNGQDSADRPLLAGLYLMRADVAGETAVCKVVELR